MYICMYVYAQGDSTTPIDIEYSPIWVLHRTGDPTEDSFTKLPPPVLPFYGGDSSSAGLFNGNSDITSNDATTTTAAGALNRPPPMQMNLGVTLNSSYFVTGFG